MSFLMSSAMAFRRAPAWQGYWRCVAGALSLQRLGIVIAITLVSSAQILAQPMETDFWSVFDIGYAWLLYTLEVFFVVSCIAVTYILADEALPPTGLLRWLLLVALTVVVSACASYATAAFESIGAPPEFGAIAQESLRWSAIAAMVAAVDAIHRRALRTRAEIRNAQQAAQALAREEAEQQLQLLQAQIEPHFLFNTLANMRSLYRTEPESGGQMMESLLRYLRAALPRVRASSSTVGDEVELARAYLELFAVRMGDRLKFEFDVALRVERAQFPPMLILTLVENAVKHGVGPAAEGGKIEIRARRANGAIQIDVADDGVGLGEVAISGTGVGLANIRRQLAARYDDRASLSLREQPERGVLATIRIPVVDSLPLDRVGADIAQNERAEHA